MSSGRNRDLHAGVQGNTGNDTERFEEEISHSQQRLVKLTIQ